MCPELGAVRNYPHLPYMASSEDRIREDALRRRRERDRLGRETKKRYKV